MLVILADGEACENFPAFAALTYIAEVKRTCPDATGFA